MPLSTTFELAAARHSIFWKLIFRSALRKINFLYFLFLGMWLRLMGATTFPRTMNSSAQHFEQQRHRAVGKLRVIDICIQLFHRDLGPQIRAQGADERRVA